MGVKNGRPRLVRADGVCPLLLPCSAPPPEAALCGCPAQPCPLPPPAADFQLWPPCLLIHPDSWPAPPEPCWEFSFRSTSRRSQGWGGGNAERKRHLFLYNSCQHQKEGRRREKQFPGCLARPRTPLLLPSIMWSFRVWLACLCAPLFLLFTP